MSDVIALLKGQKTCLINGEDKLCIHSMNQSTLGKTAIATESIYLKVRTSFVFLFLQFNFCSSERLGIKSRAEQSVLFNYGTTSTWIAAMQTSAISPRCCVLSPGEATLEINFLYFSFIG